MNNPIEVRCLCRRQPILAIAGRGDEGHAILQVKQTKSGHVTTNVVLTSGSCRVQCRDCHRWMNISINKEKVLTEMNSKVHSVI